MKNIVVCYLSLCTRYITRIHGCLDDVTVDIDTSCHMIALHINTVQVSTRVSTARIVTVSIFSMKIFFWQGKSIQMGPDWDSWTRARKFPKLTNPALLNPCRSGQVRASPCKSVQRGVVLLSLPLSYNMFDHNPKLFSQWGHGNS